VPAKSAGRIRVRPWRDEHGSLISFIRPLVTVSRGSSLD